MKKILSLLLTISMIFSTNIMIYGAEDEPSDWAKEDVMDAIKCNYVPIHLQSNYQRPITREEFAELFVTAIFTDKNISNSSCYFDTKSSWDFQKLTPETFLSKVTTTEYFTDTDNPYIKVANMLGIINGDGNHKFHPDELITREQAAVMFMNYLHTLGCGNRTDAIEQLSDLDEASSWAREAVICAYSRFYIKGTKKPVLTDSGEVINKGYFDTKGNLTREQAIIILYRIGKGSNRLDHLILRGYVNISMDNLMSGFEIDGNTVKMNRSGFNSKSTLTMKYLKNIHALKNYIYKYNSEELDVLSVLPLGTDSLRNIYTIEKIERVLSGKEVTYDYTTFNVTYNEASFLAIFRKNEGYGYWAGTGFSLYYYLNGKSFLIKCQSIK
ncbi:S-layer homology domain-containing protein [Vallitalea guaymasensis]|uniref:S-layer homology domain-containing protein n=1 Tax=Vallitalea guaymasensis TaxID=1185412 RepID=A0A8J8SBU0_9FIRM|nr:S-layer homology domain-containing protein [Vallitalea guaymasensis]QUH29123.1 S-layer homology domain-containing protein [Vallitalea guaymasensis]